jgi:hypothetical protein
VTPICCWGIFREREHSPGRETDDTQILRLTAKHLEAQGFQVFLKTPEDVSVAIDPRPGCVFLMCERTGVLALLEAWEASGVRHVNRPEAILNTYRERMISRLAGAGVPFIASRVVGTREPGPIGPLPVWVKRADVHNTQAGDVVLTGSATEAAGALEALAARGLNRAILQPHVDGDLIKFYGVGGVALRGKRRTPTERGRDANRAPSQAKRRPDSGPGAPWFRWFYHRDQRVAGHPFDAGELARLVWAAIEALDLEVYGGDAIATPSGLVLLDVNAWPSFALYRDEAAAEIAAYLARRFAGAGA